MLLDWGLTTQEAVSVTGAAGTTLTITRGIDNSTGGSGGLAHATNCLAVHGSNKRDYAEPAIHINAVVQTTNPVTRAVVVVHGIGTSSAVVGTLETQTLVNKTLTSPAVNSPTVNAGSYTGISAFTGNVTITGATLVQSDAVAGGGVQTVTNTTATPTAPNVQWTAAAGGDKQLGVKVSGDTQNRGR